MRFDPRLDMCGKPQIYVALSHLCSLSLKIHKHISPGEDSKEKRARFTKKAKCSSPVVTEIPTVSRQTWAFNSPARSFRHAGSRWGARGSWPRRAPRSPRRSWPGRCPRRPRNEGKEERRCFLRKMHMRKAQGMSPQALPSFIGSQQDTFKGNLRTLAM